MHQPIEMDRGRVAEARVGLATGLPATVEPGILSGGLNAGVCATGRNLQPSSGRQNAALHGSQDGRRQIGGQAPCRSCGGEAKLSANRSLYRVGKRPSIRFGPVASLKGRRQASILFVVCLSAALLSGCAVGPNYSRPSVPTQTGWKEGATATHAAALPSEWWQIFNDPRLHALETQAIEANQDLKRAVARVREARALARVSESELYPAISASGAYSRNRLSENRAHLPQQKLESDDFSGSFDLSYELDIWGRVRRSVEAARADAAAVATDLHVVLVTLTADVARNYCLLRSLDDETVVIEATLTLRKDAVRLQETRNQAGLINEMDVTRARTELANVEAELHVVKRARAEVEHALAVLCGQSPGEFHVVASTWSATPPAIPAGLPSSLLGRRPDIVEAEQSLEAASARIGVARPRSFRRSR